MDREGVIFGISLLFGFDVSNRFNGKWLSMIIERSYSGDVRHAATVQ
jgi:hypothetical protein